MSDQEISEELAEAIRDPNRGFQILDLSPAKALEAIGVIHNKGPHRTDVFVDIRVRQREVEKILKFDPGYTKETPPPE